MLRYPAQKLLLLWPWQERNLISNFWAADTSSKKELGFALPSVYKSLVFEFCPFLSLLQYLLSRTTIKFHNICWCLHPLSESIFANILMRDLRLARAAWSGMPLLGMEGTHGCADPGLDCKALVLFRLIPRLILTKWVMWFSFTCLQTSCLFFWFACGCVELSLEDRHKQLFNRLWRTRHGNCHGGWRLGLVLAVPP